MLLAFPMNTKHVEKMRGCAHVHMGDHREIQIKKEVSSHSCSKPSRSVAAAVFVRANARGE